MTDREVRAGPQGRGRDAASGLKTHPLAKVEPRRGFEKKFMLGPRLERMFGFYACVTVNPQQPPFYRIRRERRCRCHAWNKSSDSEPILLDPNAFA